MSAVPPRQSAISWFLGAYVQIALGALLVTASEILMKVGANTVPPSGGAMGWLGIAALWSGYTWLGIVLYVLSFLSWIHVLRTVPLALAFALISVVHVLIPIGSWVFLHESISLERWVGILLVVGGLCLVVGPVAKVEEKL